MSLQCQNCGALLSAAELEQPTVCKFCGATNAPAPSAIPVPVPVAIVHQHVTHVSSDGDAVLRCPHCRLALVSILVGDVKLSGCGRCGGIWVDNRSAQSLVAAPQRVFVDLADRASANAARNDKRRDPNPCCPECRAVLERTRSHGLELDVCRRHGTWFDSYELSGLLKKLMNHDPAKGRAATNPDATVPCAKCKTLIRYAYANVTEAGPTCDACWRGDRAALVAAAEAQKTTAAAGALLDSIERAFATKGFDPS